MRKHYGVFIIIFLVILWGGWIVFLDTSEPAVTGQDINVAGKDSNTVTASPDDTKNPTEGAEESVVTTVSPELTATPEPTGGLTPEPSNGTTPEPTDRLTPIPTNEPTPTPMAQSDEIPDCDKFIANVEESLNIRSEGSENGRIIGSLGNSAHGEIIERGEAWTKIKSGDITGYVSNDYILTDKAAVMRAKELGVLYVSVNADAVNIRIEPNSECEILGQATRNETFRYIPEKSNKDWYAIQYDNETVAYIIAEWCKTEFRLRTAVRVN